MARKSNKTAHVLNLIAGHDAGKDTTDATNAADTNSSTASAEAKQAAAPPAQTVPSTNTASQNISVIDTTEEDPVSDLIQQKLSNELEQQTSSQEVPEPEAASSSVSDSSSVTEHTFASAPIPESETVPTPETISTPESASISEPVFEAEPVSVPESVSEINPDPIPESSPDPELAHSPEPDPEPVSTPEPALIQESTSAPEPEPEPEFVRLNVMEEIVKDKIIYFMRQFDVCTCDRCVNDTIALTMNGLLPKYIVTSPAAVDPLMSYYTNRLISDVTVEATKACMIVKDNPRH